MDDLDSLRLELDGERHCHRSDNQYHLAQIARLEAENERLRAALQRIADQPASVPWPESWVHWAEIARLALSEHRPSSELRLWVNDERTILFRIWADGKAQTALRDDPSHTWGPPIQMTKEKT